MPTAMPTLFTIDDLERVLSQGAGFDGSIDLHEVLDRNFEELGFDSLAMLETAARVEREFGVSLDESQIVNMTTLRTFVDSVNGSLVRTERELPGRIVELTLVGPMRSSPR